MNIFVLSLDMLWGNCKSFFSLTTINIDSENSTKVLDFPLTFFLLIEVT